MSYRSTKTYGHDLGFSCCFRQWKAESHCRFLHGYSVAIRLEFEAEELCEKNWVVDFGALKSLKIWLESIFDHKTLVASNDPQISLFRLMANEGLIQMVEVDATGCEAFAKMVYGNAAKWLKVNGLHPRVRLAHVEFKEHGANSAIYSQ